VHPIPLPEETPATFSEPAGTWRFDVHVAEGPGLVLVCPVGEVDLATVDRVREELEAVKAGGARRVALDLRHTTFLDSSGLRLIVEAQQSSNADGWQFGVIPGPPGVQRALDIAGLNKVITFVDGSVAR
jgi:anti-sigma B factor antagonist